MRGLLLVASLASACGGPALDGDPTCYVEQGEDGTATVKCPDGSHAELGTPREEPEAVQPIICVGLAFLATQADVDELGGCNILHGSITLAGVDLSLAPLSGLRSISGSLYVTASASSLRGLEALEEVGTLWVRNSTRLTTLRGLSALARVTEGGVLIDGNDQLAALELDALEDVTGEVALASNPLLSDCQVDALLDQVGATCAACGGNLFETCPRPDAP